jgi:tyrosyl-DNA phosphodiesterase
MTSFEQPDAGLLVEHLLPSLLGGNYSLSQELQERTLFFGELGTALEVLHGRLTVISSPPRVAREDSQYPWLWRYVSHFIVGAESRAVQHAKLWAFHWKVNDEEHLELHVGSTNLTTSAFKAQMQAGWEAMLPLGEHASQRTRRTWGDLVQFLDALGASSGDVAATRIQRLVTLLGRVECPADLTFVASIPGQKCAGRQLKQFEPSELHVLTPTIGEWNDRTLAAWSADTGVVPGKIHLKWISEQHPWAATSGWALSTAARETLERNGVRVECLPIEARFTEQHREADPRWSHAKPYLLRSRRMQRLLVTSANWSVAAWGAGKVAPRNFELGALFESEWTELEALGEPFDPPDTSPYCVDRTDEEDNESALEWAEARWDGKRILLRARSSNLDTPMTTLVTFTGNSEQGISLVDGAADVPWKDPEHTPVTARFTQGAEMLAVDVLDLRRPNEFAETPLPEVDPAVAKALREAFLLQRYGGLVVDPETTPGLGGADRPPAVGAPAANYSVQAWLDARAAFNVVDQWLAALAEAAGDPFLIERVRLDGEELHSLYARRKGPAAGLVAEELSWRLDEGA